MSLKEAAAFIRERASFFIVCHVSPDEDTLGSGLALREALLQLGKRVRIACEDSVPGSCRCLPGHENVLYLGEEPVEAEAVIYVDTAAIDRAGRYSAFAERAAGSLCIDHHRTNPALEGQGFAEVNYVEDCAASGELVVLLLEELGVQLTPVIGKLLYAAISTDTGNFAYSATTARTFAVMARVMESGFDLPEANRELFRSISLKKTRLQSLALYNAEILYGGRAALSTVSMADMATCDATSEDGDGIVDALRDIDTVEVACYLREEQDRIKASLRSKSSADVALLAKKYAGGGHAKAAGCTLHMPLQDAADLMRGELLVLLTEKV